MVSFKDIFQEMAYPESFKFEEFNAIKSFSGKLKYAQQHLKRLGGGSSRVAFQIDNEKVLKIAMNKKGLAQNLLEMDYGLQRYEIIARVFEADRETGFYLEMELAQRVTNKEFEKLSGTNFDELDSYFFYRIDGHKQSYLSDKRIEEMDEDDFVYSLFHVISDYNLAYHDLIKLSSFGKVLRNGQPTLVLIDFGLNIDIFDQYYKPR